MTVGRFRIDRYSLRWRLPLLMVVLVGIVFGVFVWATNREVTRAARQTAGARATLVADQIAGSLVQSTRQRVADARRAFTTPVIEDCLRSRSPAACEPAHSMLESLSGSPPQVAELWTADGIRLVMIATPAEAATRMPDRGAPNGATIGALRHQGDLLYAETAIDVHDVPAGGGTAPADGGKLLGYVVSRRPLAATPTRDLMNRLAGVDGAIKLGNTAGDVWTDLATAVPAPAVDLNRPGVSQYQSSDRTTYLGALSLVQGTPWAVWVEFPEAAVVAPARAFLYRMVGIAVLCLIAAAVLVAALSARFIGPLVSLTELSEAIAAGDYSKRTDTRRRDEVGRLGAALNTMAGRIGAMHSDLETRVAERTEEAEHYFRLSRDLLCIATFDGRFLRVNDAWKEILGWTPEDLTATPYLDFVHPEDQNATSAEAAALAAGHVTVRFSNRYRCKDGSFRWLSWQAVGYPEHQRIYAAARDVTAERDAAAELERHAGELAAANQELEAFSYSVSHDLRAPLRHIHGYGEMLQRATAGQLPDKAQRYVNTIMAASAEMGALIDDLLAFSRMGRVELQAAPVALDALVEETVGGLEMTTKGRRIDWKISALPPAVGDPVMIKQVFVNLIGNAVKYTRMRDAARIEIGCAGEEDGRIVVFVRDNGAGFDPQYAHKLFGVFQRLHRAEEFEGTGIGLAIVRRIVTRHGGRVWAEGALDRGATFSFTLQKAAAARVNLSGDRLRHDVFETNSVRGR